MSSFVTMSSAGGSVGVGSVDTKMPVDVDGIDDINCGSSLMNIVSVGTSVISVIVSAGIICGCT